MTKSSQNSRALRIGVTIGLSVPDESLWINGIKQNALYLVKLLKNSPLGHQVVLLNTTPVPITDALPWSRQEFETKPFDEAWRGLDVVIELGGQVSPEQTACLKAQGTKLISYCCGPEYAQNIEAMIFSRPLYSSIFINPGYDCLWIIPQVWGLNRGFLQTFRRCPAREVPFIWDPMAIEAASGHLRNRGEYLPGSGPKRLSVIEPNIDVLKFCLYPILIAEQAFREVPEHISFLHVANADRFVHDGREFADLMRQLDIVNARKASFIGRVTTPNFLADYTDIVISHQWGLPLNYFYLECCWQGYPLIHNADMVKNIGYYYLGHDLGQARDCLIDAICNHDKTYLEYKKAQRTEIGRFLTTNADLIQQYDDLLFEIL